MSTKTQTASGAWRVETDAWFIDFANQQVDLTCKDGKKKHTRLCGDPHICTDGAAEMDFPTPTCSFVLDDGSIVIADAPTPLQPINDLHVFTADKKHYPLGNSQAYDDVVGTVFLMDQEGNFFGVVSRDVGTNNPNPVHKDYQDA